MNWIPVITEDMYRVSHCMKCGNVLTLQELAREQEHVLFIENEIKNGNIPTHAFLCDACMKERNEKTNLYSAAGSTIDTSISESGR